MGMFNNLNAKVECPNCICETVVKIQFYMGELQLYEYSLGDKIIWHNITKKGVPRPPLGNDMGQGYSECSQCGFDLWVDIVVKNDIISEVCTRKDKVDYSFSKYTKYR
jgi:hypothetical protein